jgi:hypothetical protein
VPSQDGLRPDQEESRAPLVPDPGQAEPEDSVGTTQPGSYDLAAENGDLLPEGEIFQSQPRAAPEESTAEQEDDLEDGHQWLPLSKQADRSK